MCRNPSLDKLIRICIIRLRWFHSRNRTTHEQGLRDRNQPVEFAALTKPAAARACAVAGLQLGVTSTALVAESDFAFRFVPVNALRV